MEAPGYAVCASSAPFDRTMRTMRTIKGPGVGDSAAVLTIGVNAAVGKSTNSIMYNLRLSLLVRYTLFETFEIVLAG